MRLNLNTKILLGFGIALGVLLLTTGVAYFSNQRLAYYTRQVQHTYQVLQATSDLRTNLRDAQGSVRNYLLLNDTTYLPQFDLAEQDMNRQFNILRDLTRDNAQQQQRLDTLRRALDTDTRDLRMWTDRNASAPTARVMISRNQERLEIIRGMINRIKQSEDSLLAERDRNQDFYAQTTPIALLISAVLTLFIVGWLVSRIWQELAANAALQQELQEVNEQVAHRIGIIEHLAEQVVLGDYSVKIKDEERDNLGRLAGSLNRMTRQLSETFGALENRNKELDQFAYVASHDLKAPLRGVTTVVKWIEDELSGELSDKMRQYLDMMKGRLSRLEDLINGLLAYARIGRTEQKLEPVDVAALLDEVTDMVVPPDFHVRLPDSLPSALVADRLSLQQVFTNLIGNAVKYHHRGGGTITIGCREQKKFYEFSVADDGPGIAPEYHQKIFLMFQTLRDRHTAESTGIGLSIVKKIIDEQKGSIWVKSAAGEGAAFIFTWPKQALPARSDAPALAS
ncbi:sensor histidine kinase [Hymenobacter guriensis]|uniref:histidine kinase n=1 Tax=Hymenobacter guriensis TaxID=2793065 RepID=A0ABS0KX74_9BACT|nr:ATP-binding protein [Hymenobacter guriensis]MBG8552457.1 CHASE3 domain-containing protein [Hymenobacter guriensis]